MCIRDRCRIVDGDEIAFNRFMEHYSSRFTEVFIAVSYTHLKTGLRDEDTNY